MRSHFSRSHGSGTSAARNIAQQLLRDPTSAAPSQDFVMRLHLALIMPEELFVPSFFPLSCSNLFHRYFTDFSAATHSVRYSCGRGRRDRAWPGGTCRVKHCSEMGARRQVHGYQAQPGVHTMLLSLLIQRYI